MEKIQKSLKKKFIEKLNDMKNIIENELENEDLKKVYNEYILFEENAKVLSKEIKTYFMEKEVEILKIRDRETNNIRTENEDFRKGNREIKNNNIDRIINKNKNNNYNNNNKNQKFKNFESSSENEEDKDKDKYKDKVKDKDKEDREDKDDEDGEDEDGEVEEEGKLKSLIFK
jgi:hypothetical protein